MTIREAVLSSWRQPLLGLLFLILAAWMTVAVAAYLDGRSRRAKLLALVPVFAGAAVLWLCLTMISWEINYPGEPEAPPFWLLAIGALPARILVLAEVLLAFPLIPARAGIRRFRNSHLTPDSIKETMDLLPVGVAFAEKDGAVVFRNVVMDDLSGQLTGTLLTDLDRFRAAAGEGLLSLGNRVWQLDVRSTGDLPLTQLTATDVTEQAGILAGLEAGNRKLKDIRLRLEMYNRQAERIIIAQELLTARMTVHNELGSVLLESRHCLKDPASIDEGLLLQALKNANTYLLREYEKDDSAVDPLAEAVGTAEAIGVKVALSGLPPAEERPRRILAAAVRECATNTVKHAEGDRLSVDARRTGEGFRFILRCNGKPPEETIRETGGLRSLRMLVEQQHGVMRVDSAPEFCLTIGIPREEADGS